MSLMRAGHQPNGSVSDDLDWTWNRPITGQFEHWFMDVEANYLILNRAYSNKFDVNQNIDNITPNLVSNFIWNRIINDLTKAWWPNRIRGWSYNQKSEYGFDSCQWSLCYLLQQGALFDYADDGCKSSHRIGLERDAWGKISHQHTSYGSWRYLLIMHTHYY